MKRIIILFCLSLVASCVIRDAEEQIDPLQKETMFYASFEQPDEAETRVYANEDLHLRWTADDRVSIFGKNTYNQQYKFLGETGDNSGGFNKVDGAEYLTGNPISHTVSVYPYQEGTKISESETITLTLPAEQHYAENTIGLGANTMVSVSSDNYLQYKNVGGYLVINMYGDGIAVSSITLVGNNGETIAGKAEITMPLDGEPAIEMQPEASSEVTLIGHKSIVLGSSAESPTPFWFVLPPVTFERGFTIIVRRKDGTAFTKSTSNSISISRNHVSKMSPFLVEMEQTQPNNIIYYSSSDGNIVEPQLGASGIKLVSNSYKNDQGIMVFEKELTRIDKTMFNYCSTLVSVRLPLSVTYIGERAFQGCSDLVSIEIPEGVTGIGTGAFDHCSSLTSITLPDEITSIGDNAFSDCSSLTSISIPEDVIQLGDRAFMECTNLTSVILPLRITSIGYDTFCDCPSLVSIDIPEGVTSIEGSAFNGCSSLTSIEIPKGVTSIGNYAFYGCTALESIKVLPSDPPAGGEQMFHHTGLCPIYIPSGSEEAYSKADYWKSYALRMRVEGSDSSMAYCSSDYSQDGEVVQLQKASVGRGINIVFLGDGFLDKDMDTGGKYEQKMNEAMEQFFAYEPYYSFRNRFNIYYVKVVSKNDIYEDDSSERKLTYEKNGSFYFLLDKSREYWEKVPNPYQQPMKVCTLLNTETRIGRSICWWLGNENVSAFVMDRVGPVLNHEIGGHGFGLLWDEYVEKEETFLDQVGLDNNYINDGYGANVDWRSNPDEVRWAHLLKDSRYSHEGLGVYEGGYLYAHGIYRATENSMMRYNDTPFNAPSREQIYKFIMKYSEGDDWEYDYEEFVKADERGRMEAAEELGPWKSPQKRQVAQNREKYHCPPIVVDENVKAVGVDKDGNVIKVY